MSSTEMKYDHLHYRLTFCDVTRVMEAWKLSFGGEILSLLNSRKEEKRRPSRNTENERLFMGHLYLKWILFSRNVWVVALIWI